MGKQHIPSPTKTIGGKKFRLHCTRTVVAPLLEKAKLEEKGYEVWLERDYGSYKLWKEVKRE